MAINFPANPSINDTFIVSGIIFTWTGVKWKSTAVTEISSDTSPELGGELDLNNTGITGTGNINITGIITATSLSGDGSRLSGITTSITAGSGIVIDQSTGNVTISSNVIGGYFEKTDAGINTTSSVGFGTTNPRTPLQVERYGVDITFGSWTASSGVLQQIDNISTDFQTAEYTLHFTNSNGIQAQKVLVMHDGTTAYSQEYGIMYSSDLLVSVGSSIHNGNLTLNVTPETGISGITTYRFTRQSML